MFPPHGDMRRCVEDDLGGTAALFAFKYGASLKACKYDTLFFRQLSFLGRLEWLGRQQPLAIGLGAARAHSSDLERNGRFGVFGSCLIDVSLATGKSLLKLFLLYFHHPSLPTFLFLSFLTSSMAQSPIINDKTSTDVEKQGGRLSPQMSTPVQGRSNVPQPGNGIGATNGTTMSAVHEHGGWERPHFHTYLGKQQVFWNRLRGKDRPTRVPGWGESLRNIALSSYLNAFLVCIPIAWVAHFHMRSEHNEEGVFPESVTFALCFLSIIPLEKMFDWGGEQMSLYLGKSIGDLLIVTLNNAVEATLAIILMAHCELRLLQSTIIGVVILHLLLIPGTAFLTGGAQIWEQNLHPHTTQLNHSLLIIGVMTILLPTAFFAALDRGVVIQAETGATGFSSELISDHSRDQLLRMSRGVAVCLLVVYIASRVFLANPPGDDNALEIHDNAPEALKREEEELLHTEPLVNPWVCMITLVITVGIMAATAEWLVESIEFVREAGGITEEWFGLILLPIVSFSADGAVAVVYFVRSTINHFLGRKTLVPQELAKARAIDLSIQFTLFWMPFLVLLAWWVGKPLTLMFDYFEVALLLGSCFLVNYVTADAKTNWVEGLIMVAFYFMIATCSWFYGGQPEVEIMLSCPQSIAEAFAAAAAENSGGEGDPVAISSRALSHSSRALFGY